MPRIRYLSALVLALLFLWAIATPDGLVASALSRARGPVDPRVIERSELFERAERRIRYAVHVNFTSFVPIIDIENSMGGAHVHVPLFAIEDPALAARIEESLAHSFLDAPGQRLRVQIPTTVDPEIRVRLQRLTQDAARTGAVPPSSYHIDDWPTAISGPGGDVISFVFTSGRPQGRGRIASTGY